MASVCGRAGSLILRHCFSLPERQPALCQPREQYKAVSQPPRRSKDPKRAISLLFTSPPMPLLLLACIRHESLCHCRKRTNT
jgi:hypothetical protein